MFDAQKFDAAVAQLREEMIKADQSPPETPAAEAPSTTPPPEVQALAAEVAAQGGPGRLPEGIMTEEEMKAHEQLPPPKSYREQQQQEADGERYIRSFDYYQRQR
jgi:hypothetical protein